MAAKTIAPHTLKLHDLKTRFKLQKSEAADFFLEWRGQNVVLTELEHGVLDRLKRNYLYLLEYPAMESIVKIVVLSPILDLAGFYEPPIRVEGEASIQVSAEDEGEIIQGSIDVLVVQEMLWVTVIEAKNPEFSITKAIPQTLAYVLANPRVHRPCFGLVVNGSEFLFSNSRSLMGFLNMQRLICSQC